MRTIQITTAREMKRIPRASIAQINDVQFGETYPMMDVSNKHVTYYNVEKQENVSISAPFTVTLR